MKAELEVFLGFLKNKGLKFTLQREKILNEFIKAKKHFTVEEFYDVVKKKDSSIGQATVFRTLKLLCESGIAGEVELGDKKTRYELKYGSHHHDHLICSKCGKCIEVFNDKIEKLQNEICKREGFVPEKHSLRIFGICKKCKR